MDERREREKEGRGQKGLGGWREERKKMEKERGVILEGGKRERWRGERENEEARQRGP